MIAHLFRAARQGCAMNPFTFGMEWTNRNQPIVIACALILCALALYVEGV